MMSQDRPLCSIRVFISYGHDEHAELAVCLKRDLEKRGHEVWFDLERLKPGGDWEAYIEEGLEWVAADAKRGRVVLLMTPHSVRRPDGYCLNEIARAVDRRLRVVPVMVIWSEPPLSICRIQWLDMRDCLPLEAQKARYKTRLGQLVEALEQDRLDLEGTQSRLHATLEPLPFDADIAQHLPRFIGREWVFKQIDAWLADPKGSRVFWITGAAGVGKTAIASWLCARRREVAAFHLCRHGHQQKSDPRRAVLSIAYQMATQLPDYRDRLSGLHLEQLIPESNAATLFDMLIVQPLSADLPAPDRTLLVVIDALDEATRDGENELAAFIGSQFTKTPDWLRLVITSRPVPPLLSLLQDLDPYELDASSEENRGDIRLFLEQVLKEHAPKSAVTEQALDAVVDCSEGVFLYAEWVRRELEVERLSPARLGEFPRGLGAVYARMFRRHFPDADAYRDKLRPVIEVIAAAQEPLEIAALGKVSGLDEDALAQRCDDLASLFRVVDGRIGPFHQSVIEWLTDRQKAGAYYCSRRRGHDRLAEHCRRQVDGGPAPLSPYDLAYLPTHLAEAGRWHDFETLLTDRDFLRAKTSPDLIYGLVRDMATVAEREPLGRRVFEAFLPAFAEHPSDSFSQRFRGAVNQRFGTYNTWPALWRRILEESTDLPIMHFLGVTHDMEERFDEAEAIFRRVVDVTSGERRGPYAAACVRLAFVLEHQDRLEEGLQLLENLVQRPDVSERFGRYHRWARYHIGIYLRRLRRYDEATREFEEMFRRAVGKGTDTSAEHQLGVIDLELGDLEQAEKRFGRCMRKRGTERWNHRRAFEHRRLGQVYALRGAWDRAEAAFDEAVEISANCGNFQYVTKTRENALAYVTAPRALDAEKPRTISRAALAERFGLHPSMIGQALRRFSMLGDGYVDEIDERSGDPTDQIVHWKLAHEQGTWHATAMVLMFDDAGRIALQQRAEQESTGLWDVSVAGHVDVGEDDESAAIRETWEEARLVIGAARLESCDELLKLWKQAAAPHEPLRESLLFRKQGAPTMAEDKHEDAFSYVYRTEKINNELASLFLLRTDQDDRRAIEAHQSAGGPKFEWRPFPDAVRDAREHPERYASAFRQLLHPDIVEALHRCSLAPRHGTS